MPVATIYSRAQDGIHAPQVTVEVHLSRGLPSFSIVGLPETTVKESKERVRSAILNNQFEFPLSRITINLAPADLPKEGGRFDLPIALGILLASGQLPDRDIEQYEIIGELSLTGELRPVSGVLPVSIATSSTKRKLILPRANADEAALVDTAMCKPATHLLDVCAHLSATNVIDDFQPNEATVSDDDYGLDINDIVGHEHAKRVFEIAVAGGHNLLMAGHPGSGKTMLAERILTILPPLTQEQALESAAIASISHHGFDQHRWRKRILRAPHHSSCQRLRCIPTIGGAGPGGAC